MNIETTEVEKTYTHLLEERDRFNEFIEQKLSEGMSLSSDEVVEFSQYIDTLQNQYEMQYAQV